MNKIKTFLISFLIILLFPIKSYSLIEVDITRGNLNPLPVAVSPLSIDEKSRKSFEKLLNKKNIGSEISSIVENISYSPNKSHYNFCTYKNIKNICAICEIKQHI